MKILPRIIIFGSVLITFVSCKKQKYDFLCTTRTFDVVDAQTYTFKKEDTITLKQVDQKEATKYQNDHTMRSVSPGGEAKLTTCNIKF
ncbi:MAG: hypothetical protein KF744_12925 [Taibaiella sp.]|nr:hypothetical protein [Taibaiella sp.]